MCISPPLQPDVRQPASTLTLTLTLTLTPNPNPNPNLNPNPNPNQALAALGNVTSPSGPGWRSQAPQLVSTCMTARPRPTYLPTTYQA